MSRHVDLPVHKMTKIAIKEKKGSVWIEGDDNLVEFVVALTKNKILVEYILFCDEMYAVFYAPTYEFLWKEAENQFLKSDKFATGEFKIQNREVFFNFKEDLEKKLVDSGIDIKLSVPVQFIS
jgi:hypothetical protein